MQSSRYGQDLDLDRVLTWFQNKEDVIGTLGRCIRTSLDEVIDTARTGRWDLDACGDQEKAYVGVKVEHVIRAAFDLSCGQEGMDYRVDGVDVDCKWSKNFGGWQIPREAVGHICLVVWADDSACSFAVGVLRINEALLVGGNQDGKRTVRISSSRSAVRWLAPKGSPLPPNFLLQLHSEDREAILRHRGGDERARELFRRCDGVIIDRHTIESIGQQVDEGRRFRGATRQVLLEEGFEVLNGHRLSNRARAMELGGPVPANGSQWVCLRTDGSSRSRAEERRRRNVLFTPSEVSTRPT
ncbi:NaeI family type II restriction endonuclease [Geodermatophilus sp. SYSU D00779]